MKHDQPCAGGPLPQLPANDLPDRVNASPGTGTPDLESKDTRIVRKRLHGRFEPSRARADDNSDKFLPKKALTEILTDRTIKSLLQQSPETNLVSVSDITGDKRRVKIFAILLLMKKTECIGYMIQRGVSDADMPLGWDLVKDCLKFEDSLAESFLFYQSGVDVPVWDFSAHSIQEKGYDWNQKLPFLSKRPLSSGGQGVVWRVEIHRDHYETKVESVS